jgi:hypothetical protein
MPWFGDLRNFNWQRLFRSQILFEILEVTQMKKIFSIVMMILLLSLSALAATPSYDNYPPIADKVLLPDGRIVSIVNATTVAPASAARARQYSTMPVQAAKYMMPDGSIINGIPISTIVTGTATVGYCIKVAGSDGSLVYGECSGGVITETDPVVGAVNGIVKANGAGAISAAGAGTDYTTSTTGAGFIKGTAPSTLGSSYLSTTKTAGTTGTTANLLVKIDNTGNVVTAVVGDVGILGVAISTKTSGQSLEVATRGIVNCVADNTPVIGNLAVVGTGTAGRCRDSGQTNSTAVGNGLQIVGKFLSVATVGNNASLQLYGPGHYGTGQIRGKGADFAGATVDLSTATGDVLDITTDATAISTFGTVPAGYIFYLRFTVARDLTYNVTSFILPGARTITTAVGDTAVFESLGSGNWLCYSYRKGDGRLLGDTQVVTVSSTRNLTINETTGQTALVTGAYIASLPTAVIGRNVEVMATTATVFSVDVVTGTDVIYLNGTALAAGNKATSDGTIRASIRCKCVVTGYYECKSTGVGLFIDGGA